MGDFEALALANVESTLKYRSFIFLALTQQKLRTLPGGQFDWGGRLLKGNGGAQRFSQSGWQSDVECNGTRELNCETYKSSRCESRA